VKPIADMTREEFRAYERAFNEALGRRIRERRLALDWTQAQLAAAAACSATCISEIEHGSRVIGVSRFVEIARALGVPPASLLPPP
jgi:transcriptional regulator with XRE-family HTH domain